MKKSASFLLALFLLLNTVGYQVYGHFCGMELKETSLIVDTSTSCCDTEEDLPLQDDSCCKSESVQVVITDHYLKGADALKLQVPSLSLPLAIISVVPVTMQEELGYRPAESYTAVPISPVPIIILNQVFRI